MNREELLFPREPARFDREDFLRLLRHAKGIEASDIHIKTMSKIMCRVHGHMVPVTRRRLEDAEVASILRVLYGADNAELEVRTGKALDNAFRLSIDRENVLRFRWNAKGCEVQGAFGLKITLRELPAVPPSLPKDDLGEALVKALFPDEGLVLVCGATGSGKSTLLAGIITEKAVDPEADCNIVTYESPVEFTYDHVQTESCLITQTAVPQHLPTFARGVENSLREDPDIVVIGEARDAATIEASVLAAQTGHAVYATVHSNSVGTTFLRLTQSLPTDKADSILGSLIDAIRVIVCQRLYPSTDGRRVAVRETLIFDRAIRRELLLTATRNIAELPAAADDMVRRYGQTTLQHAEQLVAAGRLDPMYVEVLRADEKIAQQSRHSGPITTSPAVDASATMVEDLQERLAAAQAEIDRLRSVAGPAAGEVAKAVVDGEVGTQDPAVEPARSSGRPQTCRAAENAEADPVPAQSASRNDIAPRKWSDVSEQLHAHLDAAGRPVLEEKIESDPSAQAPEAVLPVPAAVSRRGFGRRVMPDVVAPVCVADLEEQGEAIDTSGVSGQERTPVGIESEAMAQAEAQSDFRSDEESPTPLTKVLAGLNALLDSPSEQPPHSIADEFVSEETHRAAGGLHESEGTPATQGIQNLVELPDEAVTGLLVLENALRHGHAEREPLPLEGAEERDAAEPEHAVSIAEVSEVEEAAETVQVAAIPPRPPATITVLPVLDGEPSFLSERRMLLSELCDAMAARVEREALELTQVQAAVDYLKSISVPGLPQHMWQHVWARLKQYLEAVSDMLAIRLAGESLANRHRHGSDTHDTEYSWELVRRARTMAQEPFFMPRMSDATA